MPKLTPTAPRPLRRAHRLVVLALVLALGLTSYAGAGTVTLLGNPNATYSLYGAVPRDRPTPSKLLSGAINNVPNIKFVGGGCVVTQDTAIAGTLAPGFSNVYEMGDSGLGVSIANRADLFTSGSGERDAPNTASGFIPLDFDKEISAYLSFTPYTLGPTKEGIFSSGPTITLTWSGDCIPTTKVTLTPSPTVTHGYGEAVIVTCNLTIPTDIALPPVAAKQLEPVGTAAGGTAFSLTAYCSEISDIVIAMTLIDAQSTSNTSNLLTLDPSSTAKGVALQMLFEGTPVTFGIDPSDRLNPNLTVIDDLRRQRTRTYPFSARYVSTGPVSGGTVKATTVFTMIYN